MLDNTKKIISDNFGVKAGSIILAFFIWLYAHSQCTEKISDITVPITVKPPSNDIVVSEQNLKNLTVDFVGPLTAIRKLIPENVHAVIPIHSEQIPTDFAEKKEARLKIEPSVADFNIHGNVNVNISPEFFYIKIAVREKKYVKVKPVVQGKPADGFFVESVFTEPSEVLVTGPSPSLGTLSDIPTFPVNVSGRKGFLNQKMKVDDRTTPSGVSCREIVTVYITLKRRNVRKRLNNVPLRLLTLPGEDRVFKLNRNTVDITVEVPENLKDKITLEQFSGTVNVINFTETGVYDNAPVRIQMPDNVTLIGDVPAVTVTVKKTRLQTESQKTNSKTTENTKK